MSTKIEYEIQVEDKNARHGWRAIGGRDGRLYFSEDNSVMTRGREIEPLRKVIKKIRAFWKREWLAERKLRIVKIETVVTYEIVEE